MAAIKPGASLGFLRKWQLAFKLAAVLTCGRIGGAVTFGAGHA
jgi:hypothetical protein